MNFQKCILAGVFFSVVFYGSGQDKGCIVKLPAISGTYTGECKNGLADGRGTSQGIDKYYGQFSKGLPHGKGTYLWSDGTYYDGQWKSGMKDGKGRMVYSRDSIITGYWKQDKFVGVKIQQSYRITRSIAIVRSSFKKIPGTLNSVRVRFTRGGVENADIIDLSLLNDSGELFRSGLGYGIQNPHFPLEVIVRFQAWNNFHSTVYEANFEFVIYEPGNWEVVVSY